MEFGGWEIRVKIYEAIPQVREASDWDGVLGERGVSGWVGDGYEVGFV